MVCLNIEATTSLERLTSLGCIKHTSRDYHAYALQVDERDLNLLILHHLRHSRFAEAACTLEQELMASRMLPERIDFEGPNFTCLVLQLTGKYRTAVLTSDCHT